MEDFPRTLLELERRFATEAACRDYLWAVRWPRGFVCPRCGHGEAHRWGRGLWVCGGCGYEASVTAGTVFHRSHTPLTVWFRVIWQVVSQKNGASAMHIQRSLGLGTYQTAWTCLHKLRRAMVRPGRDKLGGRVEVDETFVGGQEPGREGRGARSKSLVVIAAEEDGRATGRIRMARIPRATQPVLHGFIERVVEGGAVVHTDGWTSYGGLAAKGYCHRVSKLQGQAGDAAVTELPRVHRVASLLKRWLLGTHQGAVSPEHLDYYLDEFTFRFNRRKSASRGKLFYRLLQQAVQIAPTTYEEMTNPKG